MPTPKTPKMSATPKAGAKNRTPSKQPEAAALPTHEAISYLAERYWHEQGQPHGTAEQDWLRAEQELTGRAS